MQICPKQHQKCLICIIAEKCCKLGAKKGTDTKNHKFLVGLIPKRSKEDLNYRNFIASKNINKITLGAPILFWLTVVSFNSLGIHIYAVGNRVPKNVYFSPDSGIFFAQCHTNIHPITVLKKCGGGGYNRVVGEEGHHPTPHTHQDIP